MRDLTFLYGRCAHFSKPNTCDFPQNAESVLTGKRNKHSLDKITANDQICELLTAISLKLKKKKKKKNLGGFYLSFFFPFFAQ